MWEERVQYERLVRQLVQWTPRHLPDLLSGVFRWFHHS